MAGSKNNTPQQLGKITVAIAGFAVICGFVLLVLGSGPSPTQKRQAQLRHEVVKALEAAQKADEALEQHNYGEVRKLNEEIRERLSKVQYEVDIATR